MNKKRNENLNKKNEKEEKKKKKEEKYGKKRKGLTALHFALLNSNFEIACLLVNDPNCDLLLRDCLSGKNCLHFFFSSQNSKKNEQKKNFLFFVENFCRLICEKTKLVSDLFDFDEDGETPIHLSIISGNFDFFSIFFSVFCEKFDEKNLINLLNKKEQSLILLACQLCQKPFMEKLLMCDVSLDQFDSYGSLPIHEIVQMGGKIIFFYFIFYFFYFLFFYFFYFLFFLFFKDVDLLSCLLELGSPDINVPTKRYPQSYPIHLAACHYNAQTSLEVKKNI